MQKNIVEQLADMVNYKSTSGGYNKLRREPDVIFGDEEGGYYRDLKAPKSLDPEGFYFERDSEGYLIPLDIREILARAHANRASDIHLSAGAPPKMRVDGELMQMDYQFLTADTTRLLLTKLLTDETAEIFDKEGDIDFAYSLPGVSRFRVNFFKQRGSWSAVFRTLSSKIPDARSLGLSEDVINLTLKKRGLVLVTGPTGSGKSTTLASLVDIINSTSHRNIITLEDPIEYIHRHKLCNVNQREMGADSKSFAASIRAALREDPDVILIGEMRDPETIATAVTAAETGHLVFSTLHTIGAAATIDRIIDSFAEAQQQQMRTQLSMVLEGVISQQLLPRADGIGRIAAFEVMLGTTGIRNLIRENKVAQIASQMQISAKDGMVLMDDYLYKMYYDGEITRDKCVEFSVDKLAMMKKVGEDLLF